VAAEAACLHLALALMWAEREAALAAVDRHRTQVSVLNQACAVAEEAW